MPNKLEELSLSIIGQLKEIATSESVIGQAVTLGTKTVVPVTRVMVGFGVGGGEGEAKEARSNFGGGGGGGVRVEPVGFIIIEEDRVSFLPTTHSKYAGLIEAIPTVIEKIRGMRKERPSAQDEMAGTEMGGMGQAGGGPTPGTPPL